MRIESINIHGFGCLIDRRYEFAPDRAALVIADNEAGKSTLAAAIFALICGFPKRKQAGETVKLKDIYQPWNSKTYAVEADVEISGRRIRIERDFRRDSFTVYDRDTGRDISSEFDTDISAQVLKLPREDLQRIAFIAGKDIQSFGASPNLQARLSAIIDGSQDDSGAEIAIAALDNAKYSLGNSTQIRPDTAIKRLNQSIDDNRRRLAQLDASLDSAGEEAARLDEAKARYADLTAQLAQLDSEHRAARLAEVRERVASARSNSGEVDALRSELALLEPYASFPAQRSTQLTKTTERIEQYKQQIEEIRLREARLREELDAVSVRLASQEHFATATDDDLIRLSTCESEIANASSACKSKREEIDHEMRALSAEGIDPQRIFEIQSKFDSLSPADREFIRSFPELDARLTAGMATAEAASAQAMSGLQEIKQMRSSVRTTGRAFIAAGIGCFVVFLSLMILRTLGVIVSGAGTVVGIALAFGGAVQCARAASIAVDDRACLEREYDDAQSQLQRAQTEKQEASARAGRISGQLGFDSVEVMIAGLKDCDRSIGRSDSLNALRAQLAQAVKLLTDANERTIRVLAALGCRCAPDDDIHDALARTRDALSKYLAVRSRSQEIERELLSITRTVTDRNRNIDDETQVIRSILSEAGVDTSLDLAEALKAFDAAGAKYRRYREIKDTLLPAALRHVAPDEAIQKLEREETELAAQVGSDEPIARSSAEIEIDRQAARAELDAVIESVQNLQRNVGALVDSYRREYPRLKDELRSLERELEKASRFERAIEIAKDVMKEVAESSHRRWAAALNARASDILPHLNPAYDDLRFDDSLSFTIRHSSDGRIIQKSDIDSRLSTGAKDQVYLAVRLACCAELSGAGEPIPILLDDPFMAADDSRFAGGLHYLAENLPSNHQVIILSCHRERHERLKQEKWFTECISCIDLGD